MLPDPEAQTTNSPPSYKAYYVVKYLGLTATVTLILALVALWRWPPVAEYTKKGLVFLGISLACVLVSKHKLLVLILPLGIIDRFPACAVLLRPSFDSGLNVEQDKNTEGEAMPDKAETKLHGTVERVEKSRVPGQCEKAGIAVEGADDFYQEIVIENTLIQENGHEVHLKPHAEVEVTIKAGPQAFRSEK